MNNYWKCLDCGASGELTLENAFSQQCCNICVSKHMEVKVGYMHGILLECNKCHKVKDIKYLSVAPGFSKEQANTEAKKFWKKNGILCACGSALWWWIGIGTVVIIAVSLAGYFWWKNNQKNKEGEEE